MSTQDEIVSLLSQQAMTVAELAARLDVTRNAVMVPLRQLEAEGLVSGAEREAKRVGKPALEYRLAPGREDHLSKAYPPFVEVLMATASDQLPRSQVEELMLATGKNMALELGVDSTLNTQERLNVARRFLDGLGADTLLENEGGTPVLQSFSCPLGRAVRKEGCVCLVVKAFLERVTGAQVSEQCSRAERLHCKFVIEA